MARLVMLLDEAACIHKSSLSFRYCAVFRSLSVHTLLLSFNVFVAGCFIATNLLVSVLKTITREVVEED